MLFLPFRASDAFPTGVAMLSSPDAFGEEQILDGETGISAASFEVLVESGTKLRFVQDSLLDFSKNSFGFRLSNDEVQATIRSL